MSERQADNHTKTGEPKAALKKGKAKTNIDRIAEINNRALNAGMSYGKFVAKHGKQMDGEEEE